MKRCISFFMCILVLNLQSNVLAMDKEGRQLGDPINADDYSKIRTYFRTTFDGSRNPECPIIYRLRGSCASDDDYREVIVRNIPSVCGDVGHRQTDFLTCMYDLYSRSKVDAERVVNSLKSAASPRSKEEIARCLHRAFTDTHIDSETRQGVYVLSQHMGIDEREAMSIYLMMVTADVASSYWYNFSGSDWTHILLGGAVGGAIGGVGAAAVIKMMSVAGAAVAATGGISPAAIAVGVGAILLCVAGAGGVVAYKYVNKNAESTSAAFKIQRMCNCAMAIRKFGERLIVSRDAVLNSNVLISAIDMRRDSRGTNFEDKNMLWRWWNRGLENHTYWCDFRLIPDLECAPLAKTYRARNGICLSDYITALSQILTEKVVNFDMLSTFLQNPAEYIKTMQNVAPGLSDVSEKGEDSDENSDSE